MRRIIAIAALAAASSAIAQTQQFYGADGSYRGMAIQSGPKAQQFYDADGAHAGTALKAGKNTMIYGTDGSYQGMVTNSGRIFADE
jgi:hypothetical protein